MVPNDRKNPAWQIVSPPRILTASQPGVLSGRNGQTRLASPTLPLSHCALPILHPRPKEMAVAPPTGGSPEGMDACRDPACNQCFGGFGARGEGGGYRGGV